MRFEYLAIVEVDADGRRAEDVFFDPEALDAAYQELDRRFVGEGAPYAELLANLDSIGRAFAARDEAALRPLLPDDFTAVNHRRLLNVVVRMGREETLAGLRTLDDLGVVADFRVEHMPHPSRTAAVAVASWRGSHDGSDFETPLVMVYKHDGRVLHALELYDRDQLDAALARYDALSPRRERPASRTPRRTARTGSATRGRAATGTRSPPSSRRDFGHRPAEARCTSRSIAISISRRVRLAFEMTSSRYTFEVLATRGDRLALIRERWEGSDGSVGPSEVPVVGVTEVDEAGVHVALGHIRRRRSRRRLRRARRAATPSARRAPPAERR